MTGTFIPTKEAASLTSAPHFNQSSTPITARFSSSTGLPQIPDNDPNGDPRGLAIRFNLGEHVHTDIIGHSTPFFPSRTGADFLEFLRAISASPPGSESPSEIEKYLATHPAAATFALAPKPTPASFAQEPYFGLNAYKFVGEDGKETYVRYRILPVADEVHLSEEELKDKSADFLYDEIPIRLNQEPIVFRLYAQIAEEGDVTGDVTVHWPNDRRVIELGTLKLDAVAPDNEKQQRQIIFDTIPRVKGIEPSDDPLLEMRAAVYLISGKQHRAA